MLVEPISALPFRAQGPELPGNDLSGLPADFCPCVFGLSEELLVVSGCSPICRTFGATFSGCFDGVSAHKAANAQRHRELRLITVQLLSAMALANSRGSCGLLHPDHQQFGSRYPRSLFCCWRGPLASTSGRADQDFRLQQRPPRLKPFSSPSLAPRVHSRCLVRSAWYCQSKIEVRQYATRPVVHRELEFAT